MNGTITDVAGVRVGHHTYERRPTGCTVVLTEAGAVGAVDVRGSSPGTRETDLLAPHNAIDQVHGVMLAGGSAFGLDAASGVMRWLEEHHIGVQVGPVRVPIVPAAILFDLWLGDPGIRPDAQAGYLACQAASLDAVEQGSVGAGAGATVGKLFGIERAMKGGIGSASVKVGAITVGALIAVNALGDIVDRTSGRVIAGARTEDGQRLLGTTHAMLQGIVPTLLQPGTATSIGVIATDAVLTKAQAHKLAQMAHDGLARTINPSHTMGDGDALFALATGASGSECPLTMLGTLAAEVTAAAVLSAIRNATALSGPGLPSLPAARDLLQR
jgi:L-aminopeptidase/D-esterase-like protein